MFGSAPDAKRRLQHRINFFRFDSESIFFAAMCKAVSWSVKFWMSKSGEGLELLSNVLMKFSLPMSAAMCTLVLPSASVRLTSLKENVRVLYQLTNSCHQYESPGNGNDIVSEISFTLHIHSCVKLMEPDWLPSSLTTDNGSSAHGDGWCNKSGSDQLMLAGLNKLN